jgi:hypothetical protein
MTARRCVALLAVATSLAGCSWPVRTVRVEVPVPVPCVQDVPSRPMLYTEAEILAMDPYRATIATWRDRRLAVDHVGVLEAVLRACRSPLTTPGDTPSK